jgi:hypothetical protein
MARDLKRAKEFQQRLWVAAGKEWDDRDFVPTWIMKPTAKQWNEWHSMALIPVRFCALCGDDRLRSACYRPAGSYPKVQIKLCDTCCKKHYPERFKSRSEKILLYFLDDGCSRLIVVMSVIAVLVTVGIVVVIYKLLTWIFTLLSFSVINH